MEDPSGAQIRVMTIHQSKGLEFDVVVLPHLYASMEKSGFQSPVVPLRDEVTGRVVKVFPTTDKATRILLPELRESYDQNRAARLRDELSTLYVAMTRARYALHMVVPMDGERGPGTAKTAARLLRDGLAPGEAAEAVGQVMGPRGDPDWFRQVNPEDLSGAVLSLKRPGFQPTKPWRRSRSSPLSVPGCGTWPAGAPPPWRGARCWIWPPTFAWIWGEMPAFGERWSTPGARLWSGWTMGFPTMPALLDRPGKRPRGWPRTESGSGSRISR